MLVSNYYAAAAAEDGAKACSLLMPFIAESAVEDLGRDSGTRGRTCAAVMSRLFKGRHAVVVGESASLKFYAVRASPRKAVTVLSFANLPEVRVLAERRDAGGAWRVLNLEDGILE
jgi:hypothetical protein